MQTNSHHSPPTTHHPTYSSNLKPKSMLKIWSGPLDQTTPKARPRDRNPFDDPSLGTNPAPSQAPRTPTGSSFQHHRLLHPGSSAAAIIPTSPISPTLPSFQSPLTSPYGTEISTPGAAQRSVTATAQISLHPPVFRMQQPPQRRNNNNGVHAASLLGVSDSKPDTLAGKPVHPDRMKVTKSSPESTSDPSTTSSSHPPTSNHGIGPSSSSSKGQLHLKLISASNLNVSHSSRPYVVVQYDNNEFVSREPILETEKEAKGSALPSKGASPAGPGVLSRNSSTSALSALGAISVNSNGKKLANKASANSSPASSVGSAGSQLAKLGLTTTQAKDRHTNGTATPSTNMFGGGISASHPVWKHEVTFDVTSDSSVISLTIYDRAADENSASSGFLGMLEIKPILVHDHSVDNWYNLHPHEHEKVTGSIRVQTTYEQHKTHRSLTPRDFEFLKLIGKGTFGRVFQVRKKDTKRIYAMKVLSKREIVAKKEVAHTIGERKILQKSLESPFLVGLKFSFQTDADLYLVTDFKSGGELFWHLQRDTRFTEDRARFYIAELVLALEHLHKYDIVYRDLKPENILLDATGHIALCDFGLSKANLASDQLTNTFCGTTEYLAPEVLLDDQGYSKLVDFWSLGVLLFEMCCGWSPFYAEDTQQMYKNICFGKIKFPRNVINDNGKQFVKALLNRNPRHRLGAQRDAEELKEHPFFESIDWKALALKQITPPFIPEVESDESVANFDPEFTGMSMADMGVLDEDDFDEDDPSEAWVESASMSNSGHHTPNGPLGSDIALTAMSQPPKSPIVIRQKKKKVENPLSSSVQENFKGFSYTGESLAAGSVLMAAMHANGSSSMQEVEERVEEEDGTDTEDEFYDERVYSSRRQGSDVDME